MAGVASASQGCGEDENSSVELHLDGWLDFLRIKYYIL